MCPDSSSLRSKAFSPGKLGHRESRHGPLHQYVDRILRGANPAEISVQQATKFEVVVNLKAARQLGVTILQTVLFRADQVIEQARLRVTAARIFFQPLHVGEILRATDGALVADQERNRKYPYRLARESGLETRRPSLVKINCINTREHIDPERRDADLEDRARTGQVVHCQIVKRCAICAQRFDDSLRVPGFRPDPDTEIARGPNAPVSCKRMSTDHQALNAARVEFGQQIFEVGAHSRHRPARPGTGASVPRLRAIAVQG